jgi:glycosyltransferase involved in cell wall biosynthesis
MKKRLVFTVTNDLHYDQRMQRICSTLSEAGYEVTLIGRLLPGSRDIQGWNFRTRRFRCYFNKGFLFYAEYNLRLFFLLLRLPFDAVSSIDLDSLPAGCLASLLRGKKRHFDAHEFFTEVPEVVHRPLVKAFWGLVARLFLPFYTYAYTVGPALADIFRRKYGIAFAVVRNVPLYTGPVAPRAIPSGKPILQYQGALNEGRGIEALLEAMVQLTDFELHIAGEGDLSETLRARARALQLQDRVFFLGWVAPSDLKALTRKAWLVVNLLENKGLSYYYSLANKFFDGVQAQAPLLTMDFPEYRSLNAQYEVAVLLPDLSVAGIVQAVRRLRDDPDHYARLQAACLRAREAWVWEEDKKVLLSQWQTLIPLH